MKLGLRELFTLAIVLLVPVISFVIVFRPQNAEIEAATAEISHKRQVLERLRVETASNASLREANEKIADRIRKDEARLPSSKGVDQIVRQVSGLAVDSGLSPPSLKSLKPLKAAMYWEQPLEMTTSGTFKGYYEFLRLMERMPRITRILSMEISRGIAGLDEPEITVKFTLSIYFQDDKEEVE
jgi:type IV pilus assembly protein PilO